MPLATDLICMDRSMVVLPDMIQMHSTVMLQLRSYALVSFTCSLRAMQIRDLPPTVHNTGYVWHKLCHLSRFPL